MEKVADRADVCVARGGDAIVKSARSKAGMDELTNEARFLTVLASTPFVPRLRVAAEGKNIIEDVGKGQPVRDEVAFLRACIMLLCEFRAKGVRHGDLTAKNIIVRGDRPVVIDFGESRFADEGGPHKRPKPDAYYFWRAINEIHPGIRTVNRWIAVRAALGGDEDGAWDCLAGRNVLDLGCHVGEMTAMAASEGAAAVGVDSDGFAIGDAHALWDRFGCQFMCADLMGFEPEAADIVFLFSTWAYIVQDHGREAAEEMLARLVARSQVLFFETQLRGDGPGPDFLTCHTDVGELLSRFGKAEGLAMVPIAGRGAYRSVWSVRPR